jgi:uncharacterized membrane protein
MSILHLHLLLNHIPVVGALFALLLFGVALRLRETVSTRFALAFTAALAVAAVAVYFTGGAAEETVEKLAGVTERSIDRHEEAAELTTIAMSILGGLSLIALFVFRTKKPPRWVALAGLVGTVVVSGLMAWTANLGGQIRHTEIQSASNEQQQADHSSGG